MWEILFYLVVVILLAAAIVAGGLTLKAYATGTSPRIAVAALFGPKPERRLDVVEQSNLDGRRRLVLIRRDDVEHLIMTGGPVDMVIETGISTGRERGAAVVEGPTAVYSRAPRTLGQAVGEQ
ncbi:MAG TPA: hypothetical protein VJ045_04280 [Hyphomicrobiaceae bacterium]|nr:hypothetical protein [Hyphomicrobiaceae bacterium]